MNRQAKKDLEVAVAAAIASGRYKQKLEMLYGMLAWKFTRIVDILVGNPSLRLQDYKIILLFKLKILTTKSGSSAEAHFLDQARAIQGKLNTHFFHLVRNSW